MEKIEKWEPVVESPHRELRYGTDMNGTEEFVMTVTHEIPRGFYLCHDPEPGNHRTEQRRASVGHNTLSTSSVPHLSRRLDPGARRGDRGLNGPKAYAYSP